MSIGVGNGQFMLMHEMGIFGVPEGPETPSYEIPPPSLNRSSTHDPQSTSYTIRQSHRFTLLRPMLGKQWLNCSDSADMWGSSIERSQNRQRKPVRCFKYMMKSLPLMLQAALLTLGSSLSIFPLSSRQ